MRRNHAVQEATINAATDAKAAAMSWSGMVPAAALRTLSSQGQVLAHVGAGENTTQVKGEKARDP